MIRKITLENFKSFGKKQEIELRPITLLFGPNSAGKSSIWQSIAYLNGLFENKTVDVYETENTYGMLDFNGIENVNNWKSTSGFVEFTIDLDHYYPRLPEKSVEKNIDLGDNEVIKLNYACSLAVYTVYVRVDVERADIDCFRVSVRDIIDNSVYKINSSRIKQDSGYKINNYYNNQNQRFNKHSFVARKRRERVVLELYWDKYHKIRKLNLDLLNKMVYDEKEFLTYKSNKKRSKLKINDSIFSDYYKINDWLILQKGTNGGYDKYLEFVESIVFKDYFSRFRGSLSHLHKLEEIELAKVKEKNSNKYVSETTIEFSKLALDYHMLVYDIIEWLFFENSTKRISNIDSQLGKSIVNGKIDQDDLRYYTYGYSNWEQINIYNTFNKFIYLGYFRSVPELETLKRQYTCTENAIWKVLFSNADIIEKVNNTLTKYYPEINYKIMYNNNRYILFDKKQMIPVNTRSIGIGVSQLLPIITACHGFTNRLVIVEGASDICVGN